MSFVFVSGAARSGKSKWAETHACSLAAELSDEGRASGLVYIATAQVTDAEMQRRVVLHKAARKSKGFATLERCTDVGKIASELSSGSTVLLECLGTLLANEMFGTGEAESSDLGDPDFYVQKIFEDILSLIAHAAHVLVVSNDIFSDGMAYDETIENYRRALGELHVRLADVADLAVECAGGLAFRHRSAR